MFRWHARASCGAPSGYAIGIDASTALRLGAARGYDLAMAFRAEATGRIMPDRRCGPSGCC